MLWGKGKERNEKVGVVSLPCLVRERLTEGGVIFCSV